LIDIMMNNNLGSITCKFFVSLKVSNPFN